jgi:hypothetical protein
LAGFNRPHIVSVGDRYSDLHAVAARNPLLEIKLWIAFSKSGSLSTVPDESRENGLAFRFRSMGTAYAGKFMYVLNRMEPAADAEAIDYEGFDS